MTMFNLADWEKMIIEEVKRSWEDRRKKLDEERKKKEKAERVEIQKKKKEKKRKRAIRERRCFVCGIFGHIARNCRNREEEKKGSTQMPLNKFEVLKDRIMQKGKKSDREIVKDRREILREERMKKVEKKKRVQAQMLGNEDKREEKEEKER